MGLQKVSGGRDGGWHRASVIFVGMKNAPLTAAIYEACFMNEFFRIGRTIFPSISWFFSPLLLCLMDGLWLSGFPRLPFGNLEMKIKKRRTILTFFMSIVLEYSNRKR